MYRSAVVFGLYLSFAIAIGAACSNGAPQVPGDDAFTPPSTGGTTGGGNGNGGGGTGGGGGGNGGGNGGTGFNPNLYESPPQASPVPGH